MRRLHPIRRQRFAWIVFLAIATPSWAGSPPILRFDPFRKEPVVTRASKKAPDRSIESAFDPVLFSTVLGGEFPLVNFGGEILGVGEEVHGYRLIEVGIFDAVFVKDGKTLRLEVASGEGVDS